MFTFFSTSPSRVSTTGPASEFSSGTIPKSASSFSIEIKTSDIVCCEKNVALLPNCLFATSPVLLPSGPKYETSIGA